MKKFRTPENLRTRLNDRRAAIKAAGGAEYEALLAREREARALFRARHPEIIRSDRRQNRPRPWRTYIVRKARVRARKKGLEGTISSSDIAWPTHCPVLGIELFYPERSGSGVNSRRPDLATLDRWDNLKGYVPGNVFVISMRANVLKSNATWAELEAVMCYARDGLGALSIPTAKI